MKCVVTPEKKVRTELSIESFQVDAKQLLRPSAFMDLAQEIAYQAANLMNFGYARLQQTHQVWVLSRMHFRFLRRPRWEEPVEFVTWGRKAASIIFLRDYLLEDTQGNHLVEGTSSWMVIDVASRRPAKAEEIRGLVSDEFVCDAQLFDQPAEKVIFPKDLPMELIASRRVVYNDVDVVGHTNNARYLAWVMDSLDYTYVMNHEPKAVTINFTHESLAGQTVRLMGGQAEGKWYIQGLCDDTQIFAVCVEMEDSPAENSVVDTPIA